MSRRIGPFSRFSALEKSPFSPYAPLPKELVPVLERFSDVKYPITSKKDLMEKLGGYEAQVEFGEGTVHAGAFVMFFPAQMFPVYSIENLAEKLSELISNRSISPERKRNLTAEELRMISKYAIQKNPAFITALFRAMQQGSRLMKEQKVDPNELAKQFVSDNAALLEAFGPFVNSISKFRFSEKV